MTGKIIREPRWPAFVAMLAAAGVYWALPEPLSVGPGWLLLVIIFVLLIPTVVSYRRGRHDVARILTFAANGVITLAMIVSLVFLIQGIPQHREPPAALLRSACALWIANILVFALWYWKLDAGGPLGRDRAAGTRGRFRRRRHSCPASFVQPRSRTGPDRRRRPFAAADLDAQATAIPDASACPGLLGSGYIGGGVLVSSPGFALLVNKKG